MLTRFREEYRKGRLAADTKLHIKMVRRALKKAGPNDVLLYMKVSAAHRDPLIRCGWSISDRSSTYAGGTGSSWTDTYLMSIPRKVALTWLTDVDSMGA